MPTQLIVFGSAYRNFYAKRTKFTHDVNKYYYVVL